MTTQVDVKANHGWPVKVTGRDPETGEKLEWYGEHSVEANTSRTFHVHSNLDLIIHEVQPDEVTAAATVTE